MPPRPGTGSYDFILYPAVALMCFLIAWLAVMWRPAVNFLGTGLLRYLGRISYGLYLYHAGAIALANRLVRQLFEPGTLASALSILISLAVSIAVAAASYHWLELPFLRMKNRIAAVQSVPT